MHNMQRAAAYRYFTRALRKYSILSIYSGCWQPAVGSLILLILVVNISLLI